jgi:hypothetical protein
MSELPSLRVSMESPEKPIVVSASLRSSTFDDRGAKKFRRLCLCDGAVAADRLKAVLLLGVHGGAMLAAGRSDDGAG